MHIKGNFTKYMNFERLYKSRLIVGDIGEIFCGEKSGRDLKTQLYMHPVCRHHKSRDNLTKVDMVQTSNLINNNRTR